MTARFDILREEGGWFFPSGGFMEEGEDYYLEDGQHGLHGEVPPEERALLRERVQALPLPGKGEREPGRRMKPSLAALASGTI
jgi:hypothetical protein